MLVNSENPATEQHLVLTVALTPISDKTFSFEQQAELFKLQLEQKCLKAVELEEECKLKCELELKHIVFCGAYSKM